ncbi:hypothetical protein JTE90_024985 [Oedothorax gibbosus]|uniref:RING-type E3 ubiquitin transferase n=1 Tax=Oedothorax gibbosus TaxID=931172 RepID=A0AAV6VWR4_9ARAC|nr:hypothetical protein JTE90_024985 [Oedothorax gibbosus]
MDFESILEKCAVIGIDVFFLSLFYKLYKEKSNCLKDLKNAEHFELNSELLKNLQSKGGCVPYAVITGKVKAISRPLFSEHFDLLRGVIREKMTNEHKIRWVPSLHIWSSTDNNIKRQVANVPFCLCSKGSLFQRKICVEINDPFSAEELVLSEIFDDFKKYDESFGEAVLGLLSREHVVGIREVENMLLEDTSLTAIGKLTLDNETMKMGVPDGNRTYFLSPLSYDSLVKKISSLEQFYKGLTILMCAVSAILFAYFFKKGYVELRRRIIHARDLRRCQEARKLRRETDSSSDSETAPKCVVCLENPVEILVLECGHACLCLNCSEHVYTYCPICRSAVHRLIPVFMP